MAQLAGIGTKSRNVLDGRIMFGFFSRRENQDVRTEPTIETPENTAVNSPLPHELLSAIDCVWIVWRPSQAEEDNPCPIVHVVGVGSWKFDELQDASDRIGRAYPELSPQQCRRAAKLLRAQIGRRRQSPRRQPRRMDRMDREQHDFWNGKI